MKHFWKMLLPLILITLNAFAHDKGSVGNNHMMSGWNGFHFYWWAVALVIVILITIINKSRCAKKPDSALFILKKRYAKGEISQEEFE